MDKSTQKKLLLFNIRAGNYLETLLVSAVGALLAIRFYLHINGFPQVGGGNLHIAHMLWGGLLMLVAIIIQFSFLNKKTMYFTAILGGIGFGTFIDELGKFITKDNNYFFEPTIAIIYVIFVLMFLIFRFIEKKRIVSKEEYLQNALVLTRDALLDPGDSHIKEEALRLLGNCDPNDEIVKNISNILQNISPALTKEGVFTKISQNMRGFFLGISQNTWFIKGVIIFFTLFSLFNLFRAIDVISLYFRLNEFNLTYIDLGKFISSIVSSGIIIVGLVRMRFSRIGGYKLFKLGLFVSLFLTQFFDFYYDQLSASGIFFINIFILFVVNYLISKERAPESL